ncbi:MAG: hypothetical protein U1A78_15840 [Polyangia bacterium]
MQRAGRRTSGTATASRRELALALAGFLGSCRPPQGPPGAASGSGVPLSTQRAEVQAARAAPDAPDALGTDLAAPHTDLAAPHTDLAAPHTDLAAPHTDLAAPHTDLAAPRLAHEYRFDGLKLGDLYATAAHARPPYDRPCDDDPVDHSTRRAMVYGARPCRGAAFPEGTSVIFFLPYVSEHQEDWLRQPILAFAFLGGTYFHRRTSFPLRVGDPAARARILGPVEATISFPGYDTTLRAERHPGDVYALLDGDKVVGGLLGAMPAEPASEQWDVLLQMYERYTKPR